jgi:hypothetical protein
MTKGNEKKGKQKNETYYALNDIKHHTQYMQGMTQPPMNVGSYCREQTKIGAGAMFIIQI